MYSDYLYQFRKVKGLSFLMIEDKDQGGRSVTNDIHNIVKKIAKEVKGFNPVEHNIIYKDSQGLWDLYIFSTKTFMPIQEAHWLKAATTFIKRYHE